MLRSLAVLLVALSALAACGPLPQPFRGNPGAEGRRLAAPPAYRIAVPSPTAALLPDLASSDLAVAMSEALEAAEVPAVAGPPAPLDWRLDITADREGQGVVPGYAIRDADGRVLGQARGAPVGLADWSQSEPALLREVAARDAPVVAGLLSRGEAARRASETVAFNGAGGPPRLRFTGVRGAPGDGNQALATRMRDFLATKGLVVQDGAEGAAFAVSGEVTMAPAPDRKQRVEILWKVSRRDGHDLGRALQLNEVPTGSLNGLWGDVAYVVAEEASVAVRDIIANAGGLGEAATRRGEAPAAAGGEAPPLESAGTGAAPAIPAAAPAPPRARPPARARTVAP
ncbi:hypothetical protein EAH89_12200 [Roseomonas nepalensis]|uniref:DUF4410 domain-containing protein n=1 Tax=Muricoccus nepalensis TaxID=1854500 RepID=A0A502G852_9PROT|nr:hypothetical protein [Roseomonas nepalensis]TPG57206.1 hypothetical protein EAH89_12200 [Roseomonas nepalensis]